MKAAVIGAGSWGTAVAWLLGGKGVEVRLWARDAEVADSINGERHNPRYLRDVMLDAFVRATTDIEEAVSGADAIAIVTPSHGVRAVAEQMRGAVREDVP